MKKCKVEGCNGKHCAKGYCNKHYYQMKRCGKVTTRNRLDPNEIIKYDDHAEIVLYDNYGIEKSRTLIDLDDVDKVKDYKWCILSASGYVSTNIKGLNMRLHRFIMDCPEDMVVDHINHDRLDNRKSNLRICTRQQNNMNRKCAGITYHKTTGKWIAQIAYNHNHMYLGSFDKKEDAIQARKQAEIEYFGEYRNQDEEDAS